MRRQSPPITGEALVDTVAWEFNIPRAVLVGRDRTARIAFARQVLYWLLHTQMRWSYVRVAYFLGRTDYHTIRHGIFRIRGDHRYQQRCADMNVANSQRYVKKRTKPPFIRCCNVPPREYNGAVSNTGGLNG